jgi:hypothetical protein
MRRIEYFVPGARGNDREVTPRLRRPIPAGVTRTYAEAYTVPQDTILLPYCQGSVAVREGLTADRRVLALNFDPILVLLAQTDLTPIPSRELDATIARLGDSLKQGVPLRRYLADLYATTCPACLRPAVADYFIWDRERGELIAKKLRCAPCAWDGETGVDAEDHERLQEIPTRGMHYHYILDRVAPREQTEPFRARLEYLLELYSSRNLYALAELTIKVDSLFPEKPLNRALKVLLLDCLDRCSSLTPLPGRVARQRGLSRPNRYLERNVWRAFEEAATSFQASAGQPVSGLADSLERFRSSEAEWAGFVGQGLVRNLPTHLSQRGLGLILTSPPPLDSAVWSLSYLWGAWLLGAEAVAPLRPLLRQRTPDPAWYARVMAGSFRTLAGLLRDDGRLVLILTEQRPTLAEALLLAASHARLGLSSLVQCGANYRLEFTPTYPQPHLVSETPVDVRVRATVQQAIVEAIQARGEPVPWLPLHAAIHRRLAEIGLYGQAAEASGDGLSALDLIAEQIKAGLEAPIFERLPGLETEHEYWWLSEPADLPPPLCDRVEAAAYQVLQDTLALTEADFAQAVHAQFPGVLTPEAKLVAACLRSYGYEMTPDYWQLRPEDLPTARQAERQAIVESLVTLGQRLGYRATLWEPFDVAWFQGQEPRAVFVVRWQAVVGEALALSHQNAGARPYLVIPGGRAALVNHKLIHNPLWQRTVDEAGWRFVKYRHVRQLVAQPEVDEYALRTIVGLDPIVEQEAVQIPLF